MDSEIPGVNFLKNLPHEIAIQILRYLPPRTLGVLCLVCKVWKKLAESDEVWLLLVHSLISEARMMELKISEEKMTWKTRYKTMVGSFRDFGYAHTYTDSP